VSLSAFAAGSFFAGGRVQSESADVALVRLVWDDGYTLEDEIQNGVALFLGTRDSLDPATAEFLDPAGRVIGAHKTLIDEVERPLQPGPQIRPAATEFVWRRLNEETQVVSVGGVVVAVLYTVPAGSTVGNLLEFCWLPVDRPDQVGVLFGAADGTGEPWIKRWEHARAAVETLLRANQTLP
jgi:hypothetical protein